MAGRYHDVHSDSYEANSDLSAKQFYCVKMVGLDTIDVCSAATDDCCGILQNDPKQGWAANVMHLGTCKAVSDGSGTAISPGDLVGTNASGMLVKKATADYGIVGQALDASNAQGIIIGVRLFGNSFGYRTLAG